MLKVNPILNKVWAWLKYFLSGYQFWKGEKLGKLLFIASIIIPILVIGAGIFYKLFLQPTQQQVQKLDQLLRGAQITGDVTINTGQTQKSQEKFKLFDVEVAGTYNQAEGSGGELRFIIK